MNSFPRRELALASVCAGVLVLEICLTKLFSIVLWYHFGFLAVSTALLGFASSGVYLALRGREADRDAADGAIARYAAAAAVAMVASLWLVTQTYFDVSTVIADRTIGVLLALVIWITVPFFCLGLVISQTLSAFPQQVGRLYAADLIGSACGCGIAVLALSQNVSSQQAIVLGALLVGIGALLFAGRRPVALAQAAAGAAVPLAVLLLVDVERGFPIVTPPSKPYYPIEHIDDYLRAEKQPLWRRGLVTLSSGAQLEVETPLTPQMTADGAGVEVETDDGPRTIATADIGSFAGTSWSPFRRWTTTSRVDAFHWPAAFGPTGLWGLSPRFAQSGLGKPPRQKGITIDAWAFTVMTRYHGGPLQPPGDPAVDAERARLRVLEYLPAGTVHRVVPAAEDVVIIGAGGGLDVLTAKYFGAKRIVGVEINSGVVEAVRQGFPEFVGHLYDPEHHPDIQVHVAEGRHFLERSEDHYDIVQLSGVDTLSSTEAGAFTLSENYLYTTEAFDTYLGHLKPGGVVTLTRWFLPLISGDELVTSHSMRLLALSRTALEHRGHDPKTSIFYLASANFTVILLKPAGFTAAEAAMLLEHCAHYGYEPLWAPHREIATIAFMGKRYPNPFSAFMQSNDPDGYLAASTFDLTPPTDNRPFFFEFSRFDRILDPRHYLNARGLSAHGILILILLEVLVLGLVFVIWPLRRMRRARADAGGARLRAGLLIYFTAIGFGFIAIEIVLIQKFVLFLGHPFFALAVILFSILLFSGIGAGLSARMPAPRFATLLAGGLALGAAAMFGVVFEHALHLALPLRIAISVLLLAPVGLMMGIPFPAGIRVLAASRPQLIPWAWGINGYTSVLGSVTAVILGMELGFMAVLCVAAAVYATGVIGYTLMEPKRTAASAAPAEPPVREALQLEG